MGSLSNRNSWTWRKLKVWSNDIGSWRGSPQNLVGDHPLSTYGSMRGSAKPILNCTRWERESGQIVYTFSWAFQKACLMQKNAWKNSDFYNSKILSKKPHRWNNCGKKLLIKNTQLSVPHYMSLRGNHYFFSFWKAWDIVTFSFRGGYPK